MSNSGGPATVNLYAGNLPNVAASSPLGTATSTSNTFDFSASNISLTAGQSYTFDILGGSGGIGVADTNPYAGGQQGFLYNDAGFYPDSSSFDVAFQTYDQAAVPEPATLALIGLGIIGLFCVRGWSTRPVA